MSRLLAAVAVAVAVFAPSVSAAPVPGAADATPVITAQTLPGNRLLDTIKTFAKLVGGDEATKAFDGWLKETLGEKGFTGVDLLRPVGAYGHLKPKLEESWGVVIVPVSDEKEFLALLTRLDYKFAEKKDDRGLYEFTELGLPFKQAGEELKLRMRLHDRCAYFALKGPADALAGKNLPTLGKVVDPADQSVLAVRLYLDRVDPAIKKLALGQIDEWEKDAMGGGGAPAFVGQFIGPAMKALKRNAVAVANEGDIAALRVAVDPAIGDLAYEVALTAKKGTALAKDIADRKPTTNRFAGIIPPTAVAGAIQQMPAFTPEIREAFAAVVEMGLAEAGKDLGEQFKPLVEELRKGAARTLKSGEVDFGAALTGPDKAGHYTAVMALSFDDPSAIEKALKDAAKALPEPFKDAIKFDAAKAGTLSVHTAMVGSLLPPEAQKLFGEKATAYLVFAPKAVYVAFGPDGMAELNRALALKPGPARAFDMQINPKKIAALLKATGSEGENPIVQLLGDSDKLIAYQYAEVHGGESLRVRFGSTSFRMGLGAFWLVR